MSDLIRTFISIDFPDEVIKEIARVDEIIENKPFTGKFTELENLHTTLKFLGEIPIEKIEEVKLRLRKIKFKTFEVKTGEIIVLHTGKSRIPKIVGVKINGKELWELQEIIDKSLQDLFKKEEKFNSHMTIARIKYVKDKQGFEDYVKKINVKSIKFEVQSFKLKSSELRLNGPIYRDIEVFNLK